MILCRRSSGWAPHLTSSQHGGGEADTVALAAKGKKKADKKGPKAGDKKKSGG